MPRRPFILIYQHFALRLSTISSLRLPLIVVHFLHHHRSTLGLSGRLPRCLPLCEINTDQLSISFIAHGSQGGTYNLTSLPELNNINDLFSSHNWESQSSNYLRPSRVPQGINDTSKDVWVIFCKFGRKEEIGKREVGGDGSYPVCC
jgi:hypothetical protein